MATLPVSSIVYSRIKKYKRVRGRTTRVIIGLEDTNGTHYYPYVGFNKFSAKKKKIRKGYTKSGFSLAKIKKYYCDKNKPLLTKNNNEYQGILQMYDKADKYFIHDNGGRPFLVYCTEDEVAVYKKPDGYYLDDDYESHEAYYIKLVALYHPKKIFVGESPLCDMTAFSGGYGESFKGNSILLELDNKEYVYIGWKIQSFILDDDEITEFWSPLGNSDVPYPFAIGTNYVYFLLDMKRVPRNIYNEEVPDDCPDAYQYFYGHSGPNALSDFSEPIEKINVVHDRIW